MKRAWEPALPCDCPPKSRRGSRRAPRPPHTVRPHTVRPQLPRPRIGTHSAVLLPGTGSARVARRDRLVPSAPKQHAQSTPETWCSREHPFYTTKIRPSMRHSERSEDALRNERVEARFALSECLSCSEESTTQDAPSSSDVSAPRAVRTNSRRCDRTFWSKSNGLSPSCPESEEAAAIVSSSESERRRPATRP